MKLTIRFISALIFVASLSQVSVAAEVQLDKIEAVVNQDLILSSDLANMKHDLVKRYQESGQTLPNAEDINKQVLDKLISDRLQLQVAAKMGLRISDAQLDQTLEQIAKKQNQTLMQMRADLEKSGTNYQAFVNSVRDEITINEVRQVQVRRRINITDQEVQQMIDRINQQGEQKVEFHFAHILLKISPDTSAEKKLEIDQEANDLVQKIQNGADITELARQYSEGPKAAEGGDWGWRKMDAIPSLFVDNLKESNNKDDIIGPFYSRMGVHIIKVLDKKGDVSVLTEEVNARHILIKPNIILGDDKVKELLTTLRQQILDGTKTFAELAKEYSQDPGSAVKGGELGWADPTMYVPEFRDMALTEEVGEISPPFHTVHGWHILQVLDKRQSDTTDKATKQKAYTMLFRQRFPAEVYAWLNEIRQEAYIKITNPDYIIEEE
ncbi:peptidylprolyl isomerase SurA [Psychromonas sp. RZ22]|uniref:peptidylprolyl isomerase SurA n=1 Tax=Psychromonas algarum TaxID=2555643 RepID=UPI0010673511|nr:peptidylprolyl isomerase SurA [Psychromonas sp. RZ22]TEW54405.1 peptidylprolyl isomerase SurA [Psychromonas sp. RZ22]